MPKSLPKPPSFELSPCTVESQSIGMFGERLHVTLSITGVRVEKTVRVPGTVSMVFVNVPLEGNRILWEAYLHGEGSSPLLHYWAQHGLLPSHLEEGDIVLSDRDRATFLETLEEDAEPNQDLHLAAGAYRAVRVDGTLSEEGLLSSEERAERQQLRSPGWRRPERMPGVAAHDFVKALRASVDDEKLSDDQFRLFVRNTLPTVA